MNWSTDERQRFLNSLDDAQRIVVTFYRLMLALIIVAVIVVVGCVIVWRPWGDGSQGEWFYFSVAVLMVLGWAVGQFIATGRRLRARPSPKL